MTVAQVIWQFLSNLSTPNPQHSNFKTSPQLLAVFVVTPSCQAYTCSCVVVIIIKENSVKNLFFRWIKAFSPECYENIRAIHMTVDIHVC